MKSFINVTFKVVHEVKVQCISVSVVCNVPKIFSHFF